MSQVSAKLRRAEGGYIHFCPGCQERHRLPDGWEFNGDLDRPSFSPSFLHMGKRFEAYDDRGVGIGPEMTRICHYILTDGLLRYQPDSWHDLAGATVALPDLPTEH